MTIINDRRTAEQRAQPHMLVVGTDRCLSGWGEARGGASYAAWACKPDHWERVFDWVNGRSDMQRVRVVGSDYRPGPHCAHLSIYVVEDDHPALPYQG